MVDVAGEHREPVAKGPRETARGIQIITLFGIDIGVAWSWLIIVALITWNLTDMFSRSRPDWSPALTWGVSLVTALLFFVSVLVHELTHSLVTKARGIRVEEITLFIFGGVSEIEAQPDSPRGELLMAILGPITRAWSWDGS